MQRTSCLIAARQAVRPTKVHLIYNPVQLIASSPASSDMPLPHLTRPEDTAQDNGLPPPQPLADRQDRAAHVPLSASPAAQHHSTGE